MLQAVNSGHDGSVTTLHANSQRDAQTRMETMILMAGYEIPLKALRWQIAAAIHLIVRVEQLQGGFRHLTDITETTRKKDVVIEMQDVFHVEQLGFDAGGEARRQFQTTGVRP
jgi:pilus assembly protein CpaF